MVVVNIKMRDGSTYSTQMELSLEDAEKFVFNGTPFVRIGYENGFVYLNIQDISTVVGANKDESSTHIGPRGETEED